MITIEAAWLIVLLLGLILSGVFSGLETGIYTLNRVRLVVRSSRGEQIAVRLRREMRHPARMLSVLLIGTNASNYLASFALTEFMHGFHYSNWSLVLLEAAIFTPLVFIFAETLPKDLFRTHTDRWTYRLSGFLVMVRGLLTITMILPLVRVVAWGIGRLFGPGRASVLSARQRIAQLIREGAGAGVLSESQVALADRALALHTRTVSGEMVEWVRVATLPLDASPKVRSRLIRRVDYTRLPVVDRAGRVVGIVNTLDLALEPDRPTQEMMHDVLRLDPALPVSTALHLLREQGRKTGIVIDEGADRPRGLVTLKDLVEPLTGELAVW